MIIDRHELARLLGLTPSRIQQLCAEGMPKHGYGKYDSGVCIHWYIAFRQRNPQGSSDVTAARKQLYDAQCHKVSLENERTRRETIPADEVLADMQAFQRITDKALDGLDATLAAKLAILSDPAEISAHLTLETNAIRESVADAIVEYAKTVH